MSEEQQWYYMSGEEQLGPLTPAQLQEMAATGGILAETPLWTEGLEEWVQASQVEGLTFAQAAAPHPHLVLGAEAQAAHPLAGEMAPGQAAPAAAPQMAGQPAAQPVAGVQIAQPGAVQAAPLAGQPAGYQQPVQQVAGVPGVAPAAVQPGEDYPATGTKRAGYGLLLSLMLGGLVIAIGGLILGSSIAAEGSDEKVTTGALVILATGGIGYLLILVAMVFCYIYLYRAWSCLRFGGPRTTAGKAIGFLFIPVFSVYWAFVAIYGLAQDWNRIVSSHPNLQGAPRMSAGLFLAFLICMISGIGAPVGVILWFIVYKQLCNGINFMASMNLRQSAPGGLNFY